VPSSARCGTARRCSRSSSPSAPATTEEAEESRRAALERLATLEAEVAELHERAAVLEIELAERAADVEAADEHRTATADRAHDLQERFLELDRQREAAERRVADVLTAAGDARALARRRLDQLDGVETRLAALAEQVEADPVAEQLAAEAQAVRTHWAELDEALDRLDAQAQRPVRSAGPDELEPARLVAVELVRAGHSREDVEVYLRETFGLDADPALLDRVFAES